MTTTSKHCLAAMGSLVAWIVTLPHAVWLLFILQVIDILTGFMRAYNTKQLCSRIGMNGMTKKVVMWLLVAMAYAIEHCSNLDMPIGDMAAFYYCVIEGLSVLENAGNLGLPVPSSLRNSLKGLGEQSSENSGKEQKNG